MYNNYVENGVIITPNVLAEGDKACMIYRGMLKDSGADTVFMHFGFGDNWENSTYVQMKKTDEGFEAVFPVLSYSKLNVAFKDRADNWDNNSGHNYSFEVQTRQ